MFARETNPNWAKKVFFSFSQLGNFYKVLRCWSREAHNAPLCTTVNNKQKRNNVQFSFYEHVTIWLWPSGQKRYNNLITPLFNFAQTLYKHNTTLIFFLPTGEKKKTDPAFTADWRQTVPGSLSCIKLSLQSTNTFVVGRRSSEVCPWQLTYHLCTTCKEDDCSGAHRSSVISSQGMSRVYDSKIT